MMTSEMPSTLIVCATVSGSWWGGAYATGMNPYRPCFCNQYFASVDNTIALSSSLVWFSASCVILVLFRAFS